MGMIKTASMPLTIFGIVVAAVARRLVPNCSAPIVTKMAQNPVPKPSPAQIQQAKDAGKMQLRPQPPGMRVEFPDFIQPSDLLAIDVDAKALLLSALSVATYLEKPEDAVTLAVRFGTLADGTSYISQTTLDAKAKNIRVVIENSGHRPLAP